MCTFTKFYFIHDSKKIPRLHVKIPISQVDPQIPKILGKIPSSGSAADDGTVLALSGPGLHRHLTMTDNNGPLSMTGQACCLWACHLFIAEQVS